MQKIFQNAQTVLVWLGRDTPDHICRTAVSSLVTVSNFLCERLGIPLSSLARRTLQEELVRNRHRLPLPNQCDFSTDETWSSLRWLYSHPYFTRTWAIQELAANKVRLVHIGHETTKWERIELVAAYIIMETAFSKQYGFSSTYCWWAASAAECARQPENWLFCLYLASKYESTDPRDQIYGLRGLMEFSDGDDLLDADYTKSVTEVYRDTVEAALVNFQKTDVLCYVNGQESPSCIPRWNVPMLFRNPFRFGKRVPWRSCGETNEIWRIDKQTNTLSLEGIVLGIVRAAEPYNESIFGNAVLTSEEGRDQLRTIWGRILTMLAGGKTAPLSTEDMTAAAVAFSFGLNEECDSAEDSYLSDNFSAYLRIVLGDSF